MTHDHLCRCRTCKPSFVVEHEQEHAAHRRIEVACLVVAVLLFALLIFNTSVRPHL